ncbi:hypothetical protein IKG45_00285 [Candidatus Saccharibacteria bacterium]|nr:hypothetical protein [Candidatus Saccharibacteria bacterium]
MRKKTKKENRRSAFKSFRRTYKEEYIDEFQPPRLTTHAMRTFKILFKNWKVFGGLLLLVVIFGTLFVGLMSQKTISSIQSVADSEELSGFLKATVVLAKTATTGGINQSLSDSQSLIFSLLFVLIWLATTYSLRNLLAGKKITLRQSLYNSFAPFVSTFLVFLTVLVELVPIFLLIIFYSAAIQTDFLSTPFYALIFLVFAILLIALSLFLVSSSIIALAAVSAPGLYPMEALRSAYDLMFRRRLQFIFRILFLAFVVIVTFAIIMLPIILIDSAIKSVADWATEIPVIPFFLLTMTCFNFMYISAYIYLYYREMLDYEPKRS